MLVEFGAEHEFNDLSCVFAGAGKIRFDIIIQQGKACGRNAFNRSFYSSGHRTGVDNIYTMISSMVYSTETEIRFAMQYFVYGQLYTIHGRACAGIGFYSFKLVNLM